MKIGRLNGWQTKMTKRVTNKNHENGDNKTIVNSRSLSKLRSGLKNFRCHYGVTSLFATVIFADTHHNVSRKELHYCFPATYWPFRWINCTGKKWKNVMINCFNSSCNVIMIVWKWYIKCLHPNPYRCLLLVTYSLVHYQFKKHLPCSCNCQWFLINGNA